MATNLKTDVLVVGGGGAAARTALEASVAGASVTLAVKGTFGAVGTRGAGATASAISEAGALLTAGPAEGFMPAIDPDTDLADILQLGLGLTDRRLATILVEESYQAKQELKDWGWHFHLWGIKNHGVPIVAVLESQIRKRDITILDYTMIVDLLVRDGVCVGAIGLNEITGQTLTIQAKSVVLCTGGDANLYRFNLNPPCTTGDGYALGYRAGAELMNMEFKQMTLGMTFPTKNMVFDWVFQPYVKFINGQGEEFLENYLPPGVTIEEVFKARALSNMFSTRVPVSTHFDIAMVTEIKEGRGTARDSIYLDMRDPRINIVPVQRLEWWQYRGVDWSQDVAEVAFSHHCSNGGFRVDEYGQTTLPGLYAVGECAAGPHGADRSGGHMLAACQVFGKRAGKHAAKQAKSGKHPDLDSGIIDDLEKNIKRFVGNEGDPKPSQVKAELQKKAWEDLLLIRTADGLAGVLDYVRQTRDETLPRISAKTPPEMAAAEELRNLLDVAEIVSTVCLERTESRGSHYRPDYPQRNDQQWRRCITARQTNGEIALDTFVIDPDWTDRAGDMGDTHWG